MEKKYKCLYCSSPCTITIIKGKSHMKCSSCGERELTLLGKAKLEARKIK